MAAAASRRRGAILREMGLGPLWRLRTAAAASEEVPEPAAALPPVEEQSLGRGSDAAPPGLTPLAAHAPTSARAVAEQAGAPAMGPAGSRRGAVQKSAPEARAGSATPKAAPGPTADPGRGARIATLDWEALEQDIRACRACALCERRRQAVPGVGDRNARWMLVGEGPGAEEDQRGEPFVGQAGRLLDNMLAAIGLKRGEDVYIANAVKCRPPHNRTPERAELDACLPYLERQIALVRPTLLLALGRPAAQALLDTEISIAAARGKVFDHRGVPVVVTYHPAYLLRNPQDKGKAWEDLCFARRLMAQAGAGH